MLPVFTFIPFQNSDTVIQQTSTRIYHQFQGQTTLLFSQQSSSILSKRSSPYEFTDTLNKYPKPDPVPAMTRTFQNSVNNRPPFFPLKKSIADKINFFSNMGCMEDQLEVPFLINNPQNLNQFNFINPPRREYEGSSQNAVIRQNFAPSFPLIGIPLPGNASTNPFFPPDHPNPNLLGNYSRQRTIQVIYQEIENEETSDVIPQAQTDNFSPNSNDTPFSENRFENQSMSPQEASSRGTMQNSITEKGYKDVFQTNISPKEAPLDEKDENSEQTPQIRTLSIQQFDDLREDLKDENNGNFIIPPLAMSSKDEISGLQTCKIISAKNSCQKARNQLKLKRRTPGKKEKAQEKGVKEVVSVRCGLEYQAEVRPLSSKQDNTSRRKLKNKWNPEIMSNDCLLKLTQDLEAYLDVSVDHEKLGKLILNQENNVKKVVELVKANKKKYVKLFSLAQEGNKVKSS